MLWIPHKTDEVPRVFSSHLHGKAPGNSETPLLLSSQFLPHPLLPLLPATCSYRVILASLWTPNPRQQHNQAASQLHSCHTPITVSKGWLSKGEGERSNRKDTWPGIFFLLRIFITGSRVWHGFWQVCPSKWKFPRWFVFLKNWF